VGDIALVVALITLFDESNGVVVNTLTDSKREYALFVDLPTGVVYTVAETSLSGYIYASDVDKVNGNKAVVSLTFSKKMNSTGNNFVNEQAQSLLAPVSTKGISAQTTGVPTSVPTRFASAKPSMKTTRVLQDWSDQRATPRMNRGLKKRISRIGITESCAPYGVRADA